MNSKNIMKKGLASVLAIAMAMGMLTGCGSTNDKKPVTESKKESQTTSSDSSEKPVTIKWFRSYAVETKDEKKIQDAINEYIEPLINVNVEIYNDQGTDISLALAAGDDIDLFHGNKNSAFALLKDNAALDITDIIKDYDTLYNLIPESIWEAAKWSDGKNYHVPVYKEMTQGWGVTVATEAIEKFGWDLSEVDELSDLTPFLAEAYANGYDSPFCSSSLYWQHFAFPDHARVEIAPFLVKLSEPDKIINWAETEEYKEYVELVYEWNQAGYINQDELVSNNGDIKLAQKYQDGRSVFATWTNVPAGDSIASSRYSTDVICLDLTGNRLTMGGAFGSNYMINKNSEKVDAVMKFLTLLYTDRTVADLACFGIEGEHYTRDAEGKVELINGSGYRYNGVWCVTQVGAPSLMKGELDDKVEIYNEHNAAAPVDLLAGFVPDTTAVAAELSAISAVNSSYQMTLGRGFYEPSEYIAKFQADLKAAGVEKVQAEIQKQYDAWRAGK